MNQNLGSNVEYYYMCSTRSELFFPIFLTFFKCELLMNRIPWQISVNIVDDRGHWKQVPCVKWEKNRGMGGSHNSCMSELYNIIELKDMRPLFDSILLSITDLYVQEIFNLIHEMSSKPL